MGRAYCALPQICLSDAKHYRADWLMEIWGAGGATTRLFLFMSMFVFIHVRPLTRSGHALDTL